MAIVTNGIGAIKMNIEGLQATCRGERSALYTQIGHKIAVAMHPEVSPTNRTH